MSKLMTVVSVSDPRTDKNGRDYRLVEFQNSGITEMVDEDTGELLKVRIPALRGTITRYPESYLNNKPQYLHDAVVGEKVPGQVEHRFVHPYKIGDNEITTYTTVVFGYTDAEDWEDSVRKTFRSAGHPLATDTPLYETSDQEEEQPIADTVEEAVEDSVPQGRPTLVPPTPVADTIVAQQW